MSNEKIRTNISIRQSLIDKAQALMQLRDYDNFSGFIEQLIREEHERRHGAATFRDAPPTIPAAAHPHGTAAVAVPAPAVHPTAHDTPRARSTVYKLKKKHGKG